MNQEKTFRVIFETCQEGIAVVDNDGTIVLANTACNNMFGYLQDELIGQSIERLIPAPIRKMHAKHRDSYAQNPVPRQMGAGRDLKALKKNGTEFPVEISLNRAVLKGKDHTVAFIIDITQRKKMEDALKRSEKQLISYATQLESRVEERTEELDQTIEALEKTNKDLEEQIYVRMKAENEANKALDRERELNELKSRFVSMASHEFRTPLSTILSSASLIDRYDAPGNEEKRKRHVHKIKSAISNLQQILDDFLSLSKLEEGKIDLKKTEVNVSEVIEEVIDELSSITPENQSIRLLIKGKESPLRSDEKIIKNILINLISNGIKYSEKDIDVVLTCTTTSFDVEVKDEGLGIPEEEHKHVFERFFRAKNAMNIQGTGLGLNIVKKYVDMLGGNIHFVSKLNKGTTFIVNLPKQENTKSLGANKKTLNEEDINYRRQ